MADWLELLLLVIVWLDVTLALQLLGMFGLAVLLQRSERRR
jgi:hypothetical protein